MNQSINFNEAINLLNEVSKNSFTIDAWVPSLKRTIKIQEINAKQQKSLIESAIDSEVLKFNFSKYFYEILLSNCQEEKDVIDNFTIADRNCIAFYMRNQISENITVLFSENPKIEESISIQNILDKYTNYVHPEPETVSYSKSDVLIEVQLILPKLCEESKFDTYIYGNLERKENELEDFKGLLGAAFLGETSKYIKDISINNSSVGYDNLHIPQKIQFVEKLPAALVQKVIDKIVKWKEELEKTSTVCYEDRLYKTIEVNSLLFLNN